MKNFVSSGNVSQGLWTEKIVFFLSMLLGFIFICELRAADNIGNISTSPGDCGSSNGNNSFYLYFGIGQTSYTKPDLLTLARRPVSEGYYLGRNPASFDQFFDISYTENLTSNLSILNVTIEKTSLDASVLLPASLKIKRSTSAEVIESNGTIQQVLTANTLANVSVLPVGFHIKVYNKNSVNAKGADGLYVIPGASVPMSEWIMRTPGGGAFSNMVESIVIDRKNSGAPRVEVNRFTANKAEGVYSKMTYEGSLDTAGEVVIGGLLETDVVTYSNRGAKPYDYTLIREISRVTTTASGPQYGSLKLVSRRLEEYKDFTPSAAGGMPSYKRRMKEVDGYLTSSPRETRYTWYDDVENPMIHGRLKTMVLPDGYWEYYTYVDSAGAAVYQQTKYSAWRDASFGAALDGSDADLLNAKKEVTSVGSTTGFTRVTSYAEMVFKKEVLTVIPQPDGSLLNTFSESDGNGIVLSSRAWLLNSSTAQTFFAGRIAWMENPDGTADSYSYTPTPSGGFRLVHRSGVGTRSGVTAGNQITTEYNSFAEAAAETTIDITTGLVLNQWIASQVDLLGRPLRIEYNGNQNDYETFQYSCCGLERRMDRDGGITTWARDPLKRIYRQSYARNASETSPQLSTFTHDGLTTTEWRGGLLVRSVNLHLNGEVISTSVPDEDGDGLPETITHRTILPFYSGKTVIIEHPNRGVESLSYYLDGQIKSSAGPLRPYVNYSYGVEAGGTHRLIKRVSKISSETPGGASTEVIYTDALNRLSMVENPDEMGDQGAVENTVYNYFSASAPLGSRTQLETIANSSTGSLISYTYNARGWRTEVHNFKDSISRKTVIAYAVVDDTSLGVSQRITTTINGGQPEVILKSGDGDFKRRNSDNSPATVVRTPYQYLLELRCDQQPAGWNPGLLKTYSENQQAARRVAEHRE